VLEFGYQFNQTARHIRIWCTRQRKPNFSVIICVTFVTCDLNRQEITATFVALNVLCHDFPFKNISPLNHFKSIDSRVEVSNQLRLQVLVLFESSCHFVPLEN
jgi:hypothetical protein